MSSLNPYIFEQTNTKDFFHEMLRNVTNTSFSRIKLSFLLKLFGGILSSYILIRAGKIYFHRRKYRHIPGPETTGLDIFLRLNSIIILLFYQ